VVNYTAVRTVAGRNFLIICFYAASKVRIGTGLALTRPWLPIFESWRSGAALWMRMRRRAARPALGTAGFDGSASGRSVSSLSPGIDGAAVLSSRPFRRSAVIVVPMFGCQGANRVGLADRRDHQCGEVGRRGNRSPRGRSLRVGKRSPKAAVDVRGPKVCVDIAARLVSPDHVSTPAA